MKKKVIVICSIVLAVCIGLGIPLVTANIQDSAVLNRKESLSDADARSRAQRPRQHEPRG